MENKKILINIPNPKEQGASFDPVHNRQQWRDMCFAYLNKGRDDFIKWQDELIRKVGVSKGNPLKYTWEVINQNNEKKLIDITSPLVFDFSNCVFDKELIFESNNFYYPAWFGGATFKEKVSFTGSEMAFQRGIYFRGTVFEKSAHFTEANFNRVVDFSDSTFYETADFKKCRFHKVAVFFKNVHFISKAQFESAIFEEEVCFDEAIFNQEANFSGEAYVNNGGGNGKSDKLQTFKDISFLGVHFKNRAIFNNRDFRGTSKFGVYEDKPTRFDLAPLFHNCKLSQGTTFVDAEFVTRKDDDEAVQAFNTLKLAMSQQQSTRDEHLFIQKELETERLRATDARKHLYWLYKHLSEYGFSVRRPIIILLVITFIFGFLYGFIGSFHRCASLFLTERCNLNWETSAKTFEFTLIQSLPPLGFERYNETLRKDIFQENYSLGLSLFVVLQKIIAISAWFFIGLALRNLFKMK
jgi:uncharacterized protein YjbI with pentapeptide repeats